MKIYPIAKAKENSNGLAKQIYDLIEMASSNGDNAIDIIFERQLKPFEALVIEKYQEDGYHVTVNMSRGVDYRVDSGGWRHPIVGITTTQIKISW
jgi:hypothetical protein